MSKTRVFMENVIFNKINNCKRIYKTLSRFDRTVIDINNILGEVEVSYYSEDYLQKKIKTINSLKSRIQEKNIFKNRYKLERNVNFCHEVLFVISWIQDYYKYYLIQLNDENYNNLIKKINYNYF